MSRLDLLTVVIVAICLAALGYLLFKTFNMIGGDADTTPERTEYTDTATDGIGTDDTYDPYEPGTDPADGSELTEDVPTVESQEGYAGTSGTTAETDFDSDYAEPTESEPATTATPDPAPTTTTSGTGNSEGQYMVIAGTFRQLSNAERRVSQLINMGYSETRLTKFDRGTYAVALVKRFSSLSSARELERELEAKGIEAEVITD